MLKTRVIWMAFVAIAMAVFAAPALAIYEQTLPLRSELEKAAKGTIEVENDLDAWYPGDTRLTITAKGLEPNSVYTVWLAKDEPSAELKGLGVGDYSFTTDGSGTGRFIANVAENELMDWDKLEIAFHPDGNPANLADAQIVMHSSLEPVKPY